MRQGDSQYNGTIKQAERRALEPATMSISVFVYAAADELAYHGFLGDQALVNDPEELERGQHLTQLVKALDALGHGLEQLRRRLVEHGQLVGERGVELIVGLVLIRGDVQLLTAADVCPHTHRLGGGGAAEVIVPNHAPHKAEPRALEDYAVAEEHVAARGDIELEGFWMRVRYHVVESVDALDDDDLILLELDGLGGRETPHAPGKFVLRHVDALTFGEHVKVPVHKLHVKAERGFKIQIALRCAGAALVDGLEIIVHANVMRADAAAVELLGDLHRGRGLA